MWIEKALEAGGLDDPDLCTTRCRPVISFAPNFQVTSDGSVTMSTYVENNLGGGATGANSVMVQPLPGPAPNSGWRRNWSTLSGAPGKVGCGGVRWGTRFV